MKNSGCRVYRVIGSQVLVIADWGKTDEDASTRKPHSYGNLAKDISSCLFPVLEIGVECDAQYLRRFPGCWLILRLMMFGQYPEPYYVQGSGSLVGAPSRLNWHNLSGPGKPTMYAPPLHCYEHFDVCPTLYSNLDVPMLFLSSVWVRNNVTEKQLPRWSSQSSTNAAVFYIECYVARGVISAKFQ